MDIEDLKYLLEVERGAADYFLKEYIRAKLPDAFDDMSQFEQTSVLRSWVYAHTNFAVHEKQLVEMEPDHWSELNLLAGAGAQLVPHLTREVGDMCGHISNLMNKVFVLFGFVSGRAGWQTPSFGHTYSVVKIDHNGREIWVLQDATYDAVLRDKGQPANLVDAIKRIVSGDASGLKMVEGDTSPRAVLLAETELSHVEENPDFYTSDVAEKVEGDTHVFRYPKKWDAFVELNVGDMIIEYVTKFGLPKLVLSALVFSTHGPTMDAQKIMFELRDTVLSRIDG